MSEILSLDFDGVLHSYTSGWQGAHVIPDPPVPGAMEFLVEAANHFSVCVFSSRSHQKGGIRAMAMWIGQHLNDMRLVEDGPHRTAIPSADDDPGGQWVAYNLRFPLEKPPSKVALDDRGILFTGTFPPMEDLINFKPWNER